MQNAIITQEELDEIMSIKHNVCQEDFNILIQIVKSNLKDKKNE